MKRIDHRTVEYTDRELAVVARFDTLLDRGKGIPQAVLAALPTTVVGKVETWVEPEFVSHLSDGSVVLDAFARPRIVPLVPGMGQE